MKATATHKTISGLFHLGALYPEVTGGMEVFNYYFLDRMIHKYGSQITYLGEKPCNGHAAQFVPFHVKRPARIFYPFQFFNAIRKFRKKANYCYLCFAEQSWVISYAQSLVLRLFRIPYIVTIHWGKKPTWRFPYPFVSFFRHAHAIIGVSRPICEAYKKAIPDRDFIFIPPLIPFSTPAQNPNEIRSALGLNPDDKIFFYVGSLKGMKNPDKILEALVILGVEYLQRHHIRLVMAGSGDMEDNLKNYVSTHELEPYVSMEGLVERDRVPAYFRAADYFIISSDYEGTSVSLLEAMYHKLPIIASDAPGINDMLTNGKNALLYPTNSPMDLAAAIRRLVDNPELATGLGEAAFKEYAARYSYESMLTQYSAIFSSVIE